MNDPDNNAPRQPVDFSGLRTTPLDISDAGGHPAKLAPGQKFAQRYCIEALLGEGGAGVVYRALDQTTDEQVALKLIRPSLARTGEARKLLVRETVVARNIRHPNVVAVHDVGVVDEQAYMVMELLQGRTLRSWISAHNSQESDCPYPVARTIVSAILDGLEAAHKQGVVHRDLKPENIIILSEPSDGDARLKLLDFGLARADGTQASGASLLGTPFYMAPEQITAPDTARPSADFYSLSVIFYELLVGVLPQGHWQPPSKGRSDVPAGIDALIEAGLSNRARTRPQTAGEYRSAMQAASTPAKSPSPPPAPSRAESDSPKPPVAAAPSAPAPAPAPARSEPQRPVVDVGGTGLSREFEPWLDLVDSHDRPIPFMPGKMQPFSPDAEKRATPEIKRAWDVAEEGRLAHNSSNRALARTKSLEAQKLFLVQIVTGSVEARFEYARFIDHKYMSMHHTPEALAAIRAWRQAAADEGHAKAKLALAWMLRRGDGGPRDRLAAWKLFDELAKGGNAEAVTGLAYLYGDEGRDEEQRDQLRRYLAMVKKGGDLSSLALNRLALLALEGKGGPVDKDEALAALSLAAKQQFARESRQLMQQHFPKQAAAEKKSWPS